MRKRASIALTFLVMVLLAAIFWTTLPVATPAPPRDRTAAEADPNTPSPAPMATATSTAESDAADLHAGEDPNQRFAADEKPGRAVPPPSRFDFDFASETEIRARLREAIRDERRTRPLFVAPEIVDHVATHGRVRVIFDTGPDADPEAIGALLGGSNGGAIFESVRVFPLLGRGAARVGPQALLHLIQSRRVRQIEFDAPHYASLEETIPIVQADLAHDLGYDGDGLAIAILDTGVDPDHPMYASRIIEEACFSVEKDCPNGLSEMFGPGAAIPCPIAGCGHGTRVAGILAGEEPGGSLVGVAPHADLIVIQIFSEVGGEPAAFSSDILAGLQHVLALSVLHPIAATNLSLGGSVYTSEASCDGAIPSQLAAISMLRTAGILTVAASGNEFFSNAITTPACLSNVISVGSTSDSDVVSSFSNSASFLRLLAPGESVESSRLGGGTSVASGTSMASAHVSGAIAVIREAVPAATADEIDNALALTGVPVLDSRNDVTTPRLRIQAAITMLESTVGGGGSTPASAPSSSGGGGGGCGLVGLEPLVALGLARLGRRGRSRRLRS